MDQIIHNDSLNSHKSIFVPDYQGPGHGGSGGDAEKSRGFRGLGIWVVERIPVDQKSCPAF